MLKLVTAKKLRGFLAFLFFLIPVLAHAQKPGSFYWGDSDMDGIISGNDYATVVSVYMDNTQNDADLYFGYPQSRYRQDLDGDGLISGADISFLESWFVGDWNTYGAPATLEWAGASVGLTLDPADTVGIEISAISYSSAGAGHWPRTGFGIIFAIDPTSQCASTAQIYGFDPVGGATVWDWRNPVAYDYQPTLVDPELGIAAVKVRAVGCALGSIIRVTAYIPGDMEYLIPGQRNPARLTVSSPTILEITVSTGDTTPPETTITSQPLNPSNSADASFEFTCNEASCTFECQIDSGGFASCPSPQSYLSLSDGSHTFEVQAIDNSNNIDPTPASYAWSIDTIPPETIITTPPPDDPTTQINFSFSFTCNEEPCTFWCYWIVNCYLPSPINYAPCQSPFNMSCGAGCHCWFDVSAGDAAGNYDELGEPYSWNTISLETTIDSFPQDPSTYPDAQFGLSCNFPECTYECQMDWGPWTSCSATPFYSGLLSGYHLFWARATDRFGTQDLEGDNYTWLILGPDTSITSYPPDPSGSSTAEFRLYCNAPDCAFECMLDGGVWTSCSVNPVFAGLAIASHTLQARAKDPAGNIDPTPAIYSWSIQLHDVWIPTATAVPQKLVDPVGVWTGSEMIVLGNDTCNLFRYNPDIDNWLKAAKPVFLYTRDFSAIWTGAEIIIWGGRDWEYPNLDIGGRYDSVTDSWTLTSLNNAPYARKYHTVVWTGDEMIIWGGNSGGFPQDTGGKYNPYTNSWIETSITNAPTPRQHHTAIWTGSEMIIWGGTDETSSLSTGGRYDPAADSWTATSTTGAPAARELHTAVWTGSEMIVWGGFNGVVMNTGAKYNPITDSWTPTFTGANVPIARISHSAVWTGNEMIVWGGEDGSNLLGNGGRYDPLTDIWTAVSLGNAPVPRSGHVGVWTGDEMIIWGGLDNRFTDGTVVYHFAPYHNDGARYSPVSDSWTPVFSIFQPEPRYKPASVWTGSEMIVYGCMSDGPGVKYNPATDSWAKISELGIPTCREDYSAVWTGTEMIIWGGFNSYFDPPYLNTGARYNSATDSWMPTTTLNAYPQEMHTAVWTGTEMIVWGGEGSMPNYAGQRYNPLTDSWIIMSTQGAPQFRLFHTAVWTGTEMIVWGGNGGGNTGGAYKPSNDHWNSTPTNGAPSPREYHTAVWTGSEMIVWGGYAYLGGVGFLNDGAKLTNNTWTPLSLVNAPAARELHSAVWTGTEMIIWGGWAYPIYLNNGGRYDPLTDSWTATTLINAPEPRRWFPAVWAGNQMIIWGGDNGSAYLNTGGRYFP